MSPPVPTESDATEEEDEEVKQGDDSDGSESFSGSYVGWDIDCWNNIHGERDPDLTFPEDQAQMFDSGLLEISQVDDRVM